MRLTIQECNAESKTLGDSLELAQKLDEIADDADTTSAYFLREAAQNLRAYFTLTLSLVAHVSDKPDLLVGQERQAYIGPNHHASSGLLLRLPEVSTLASMSRTQIYDRIQVGTFPKPIKQGKASVWVRGEIEAWVQSQISEGPRKA